MLIAYAESYQIKHQDEIPSAHYAIGSELNVVIYTCVIYYHIDGKLKHHSFAVISDHLYKVRQKHRYTRKQSSTI